MKEIFAKKLDEIADILINSLDKFDDIGVLSGNSGLAMFMFYYYRYTNSDKYARIGEQTLERAVEMINDQKHYHTYCNGIAGFAWTCEHLAKHGFIDHSDISFLADLDQFIFNRMKIDFNNGYYDFLHGALGEGYYFINKKDKSENIESLLVDLERLAIKSTDGGMKWLWELDAENNKIGTNISLSHGMSSIVGCLTTLIKHYPKFTDKAMPMLDGAVKYIVEQRIYPQGDSCFPNFSLEDDKGDNKYSRLGWCYGDPGIALSLLRASKALCSFEMENTAMEVLLYNCTRRSADKTHIVDAGICHGSVGVAQIYNRLYRNTGNHIFRETSEHWFNETLKMATFEDGLAGFKCWAGTEKQYGNSYSLLDGITGIGLCLMSYLDPDLMDWDEVILLS